MNCPICGAPREDQVPDDELGHYIVCRCPDQWLVLSLWQPWAAFVAEGIKRIETRSWPTRYRGPLLIHATKKRPKHSDLSPGVRYASARLRMDYGALVARCIVQDVVPTERVTWLAATGSITGVRFGDRVMQVDRDEPKLGDYSRGRFAWLLGDVHAIDPPIPARGMQGLWKWAA